MHILHLGKYYPPHRGGIETVVEQLARGTLGRGLRVSVLVSNDGPNTSDEIQDGVRVIRLARSAVVSSQPLNWRLSLLLRSLDFDLLHLHTPNPLGALAVLMSRVKQPVIVTHHSDIVRQRILGGVATAVQSLVYRRAASIVAATPRHITHSPVLRTFAQCTRVIHYAIDPQPFAAASSEQDFALPETWRAKTFALFVGRLVGYKGVGVLLDAVARAPETRVAIVGIGPLDGALRAQARRLGLGQRVIFLGGISPSRLRSLYKCAAFLVLPSVDPSEAFGMVQLEAMAAGTPVISTDLPSGVPYVNQHQVTGLVVTPRDADALACAMTRLASDDVYRSRLGENALRRVNDEFTPERIITEHLRLYNEVCCPIRES